MRFHRIVPYSGPWLEPHGHPVWNHRADLARAHFQRNSVPPTPEMLVATLRLAIGAPSQIAACSVILVLEDSGFLLYSAGKWARDADVESGPWRVQASPWDGYASVGASL